MKNTNELIQVLLDQQLIQESNAQDIAINNLTFDSRQVKFGNLFFCKGANFKKDYLLNAKSKGAIAYVSEVDLQIDLPRIIVNDIRLAMSYAAKYFYDCPDQKLKLIGITGSKGKSTTVAYLKGIFDSFLAENDKKPCGIISTIETFDGILSLESNITTPEALDLFRHLANAVKSGLEYMVVEVSSQALKYDRVTGIEFDIVGLLNLGQDHISPIEHPSYEDYINSKLRIFDMSQIGVFSQEMDKINLVKQKQAENKIQAISFSTLDNSSDYFAYKIDYHEQRTHFKLDTKKRFVNFFSNDSDSGSFSESLAIQGIGAYNVENAMCAIAIADYFGVPRSITDQALKNVQSIGRDHLFITKDKKIVCHVNYAHTRLSFEKSFAAIKELFPDYRIVAMFGTSGSKALNRITDLPSTAAQFADFVYLVPDDPGIREHAEIAQEMAQYLIKNDCPFTIAGERESAIREAFRRAENSGNKTVLFLAGKGADNTQRIGEQLIRINSDLDVASKLVADYNDKI